MIGLQTFSGTERKLCTAVGAIGDSGKHADSACSGRSDITSDETSNPERQFFKQRQTDALFDAYENLDYREHTMVADHLGFCTECYGIYELGKTKTASP